jgi:hypothetical protein
MDPNYLYSLVSALIGFISATQDIYERYQKDSVQALLSLPGLSYVVARGLLSMGAFVVLYNSRAIQNRLLLFALICGAATELFMRIRIFIREERKPDGTIEEISLGPFSLLQWYRNYILDAISIRFAQSRLKFVRSYIPKEVEFPALCNRVLENLGAGFSVDEPSLNRSIETTVMKLKDQYDRELQEAHNLAKVDEMFRLRLGFTILGLAGRKGFKVLLSP